MTRDHAGNRPVGPIGHPQAKNSEWMDEEREHVRKWCLNSVTPLQYLAFSDRFIGVSIHVRDSGRRQLLRLEMM